MSDRKLPTIPIEGPTTPELPLEDRYTTMVTVYKYQYFAIFRHIAERFGWEVANDIADEMAAESIPHIAQGYKRKFGLPGTGADLVAQVMSAEFQVEGGDVETVHESDDAAEYHVRCSFGEWLQDSGKVDPETEFPVAEGLCHRGCWGFTQRVTDTVKDGLKVERLTWMGEGAPRCQYRISPAAEVDEAQAGVDW